MTGPPWGAFAEHIATLGGPDVAAVLEGTAIQYWRFIRTASYVDKNMPTQLDVIGPEPVGYWHVEVTLPATALERWHGYRYMVVGAVVPAEYEYPSGAPYWRLYDKDTGLVREQLLLLAQYAAAEGSDTYAKGLWDPVKKRMHYSTHTIPDRPVTDRESKLAKRAQDLIETTRRKGRPLEVPVDALATLQQAAGKLTRGIEPGRVNLSFQTGLTEWGVDKLLQRAGLGRISGLRELPEFSTKRGLPGDVK